MAHLPRCWTCKRPIRDRTMLRNPRTGRTFHRRSSCRPHPHRRPRRNILGFHPVTGRIRRRLAARRLRKAGVPAAKAKMLAAARNPARPQRLPGGMYLYHGWLIDGERGRWFVRDSRAKESDPTYGPVDNLYAAMSTIDWHRMSPEKFGATAASKNPSDLDRAYMRDRFRRAGVKLHPLVKKSGPRQYLMCKVCGQDFGGTNDLGRYIQHVKSEHPKYVTAEGLRQRDEEDPAENPLRRYVERREHVGPKGKRHLELVEGWETNPVYPAIRGRAFERRWERMVRAIKRTGGAASPWAVATARLGGYPASRRAARNPSRGMACPKCGRQGTVTSGKFGQFTFHCPGCGARATIALRRTKEEKDAAAKAAVDRLNRDMARRRGNPSRRVARKMRVLRSRARGFERKHQRAVRLARRAGRFGAAAGSVAFPEVAIPARAIYRGVRAARRNPANKAATRYLDMARAYIAKGAFRSADDAIQRAILVAGDDSMERIQAEQLRGRLTQALLDRQPTGLSRMWEKIGKNPQVDGAEAVEITYRARDGQLWRHKFTEDSRLPLLRVRKGRRGDKVTIAPTRVTRRGIGDTH